MHKSLSTLVVELRVLVGFLGEKSQHNWWGSNFISTTSEAFLVPVFSRTTMLARYHGVCEAAMLVHDKHIGVGSNFHLYRLPDSVERAAAKELTNNHTQSQISLFLDNKDTAQTQLSELASVNTNKNEGPLVIGNYTDKELKQLLLQSASHYSGAFNKGYKCFPYMREAE